jgi:two-component system sensor histidine kinase YesM
MKRRSAGPPARGSNIPWFRSIVFKQMITYLLMMLPIVCIFILLYSMLSSNMMAHMTQIMTSNDKMMLDTFNDRLVSIKHQQVTLLSRNEAKVLSQLWAEEDYSRIEKVRDLQERLTWICEGNDISSDIDLYLLKAGVMISNKITRNMADADYNKVISARESNKVSSIYAERDQLIVQSLPANELQGGVTVSLMCETVMGSDDIARVLWSRMPDKTEAKMILVNGSPFVSRNLDMNAIPEGIALFIESARAGNAPAVSKPITIGSLQYLCTWFKSSDYDVALLSVHPYESLLMENRKYTIMIPVFTGLFAVIALCFFLYFKKYIERPIVILSDAFRDMVSGQERAITTPRGGDEFSRLYDNYNETIDLLRQKNEQVYSQRLQMQRSQLKQLQAQIDPHFLYNSLFIVKAKIRKRDYNGAIRLTELLGEYFQFINRNAKDFVPLKDEMAHAQVYAQIQNTRFAGRFNIQWQECPPEYADLSVPRLVIQPLIENSIKYGLEEVEENGLLRLYFEREGDTLNIMIENSGAGITPDKIESMNALLDDVYDNSEITSTVNIHRRIKLYFGQNCGIRFALSELGGVRICLSVSVSERSVTDDGGTPQGHGGG